MAKARELTSQAYSVLLMRVCELVLNRRLESVAAADRRHPKVQARVARVPALIHHLLRSLVALPDLQQLICIGMALAKVSAKSALTIVYLRHRVPTSCL
jgi:hypothetical protein